MGVALDAFLEGILCMISNMIVPTLNQYYGLQRMLDSIDYPVNHLLVIDNGGLLGEILVPTCVQKVTVLHMPSNLGVAGSWNLGIKSFPHDDRWFIASDDIVFAPGTLEDLWGWSHPHRLILSDESPHWQFFIIGEEVVGNVGLFDEAIYPANFEDDEYQWRMEELGFELEYVQADHEHYRHSTVFSPEYARKNQKTYTLNESYFLDKKRRRDYSDGNWLLARRRLNSWD